MKRAFDLMVASLALVLLAPLMIMIAIVVKLADGDRAVFAQQRVGQFGRLFRMYKFRTMVSDAETLGPQLTVGSDSRITSVGHWLRRTKLDELPQLYNVLKGDMSLVGPRPEVPKYVAHYSEQQRRVLSLRPGITDPASICYFNESRELARFVEPERAYLEDLMPAKIRHNLAYAERRSLMSDLVVLFQTIVCLCGAFGSRAVTGKDA